MHRSAILGLAAVLALTTGCGDSRPTANSTPATPGSYQNGGGLSPFYAEEVHDGRLHVFGSKKTLEEFHKTKEMNPLASKRLIGKGPVVGAGPQRMTIIVETTKDEPAKDKRILRTVAERYNLTL
ncbi:MAG: hypothetical protein H0W78_11265 [Planctomycetes bacterium]|nr:hypothetical protein [Planctomycetota bacterium]